MNHYHLLIFTILLANSTGAAEREVSAEAFNASIYEAASHAENLHRININDVEGLRSSLQEGIALDVKVLWSMVQAGEISDEKKAKAFGVLRLIAVQNERFPNQYLNSDKEITTILQVALSSDPQKTAEVRSRNWDKAWWVK